MKTIDEAAKNSFDRLSIAGADTNEADFIGGFKIGVEFAQRWITPSEELPKNREVVLAKVPMINYPLLFSYNQISSKWFQFDDGDFYESEICPTHWRPIERY